MSDITLIKNTLRKYWSDDCEVVGEEIVEEIIQDVYISGGKARYRIGLGGHNIDSSSSIELLASAVSLICSILECAILLKEQHNRTEREKLNEIIEKLQNKSSILSDRFEEMALEIIKIKEQ
jgi:hypothetical protein